MFTLPNETLSHLLGIVLHYFFNQLQINKMTSKLQQVQRYTNFISRQLKILKEERQNVIGTVDDEVNQVEREVDAWVNGGVINQSTFDKINNRIQQVITFIMAMSVEVSDQDIQESGSDLNQMTSAKNNNLSGPTISHTREEAEEKTLLIREETLNKSGIDSPYITITRFAILEEAVLSLKNATEQFKEKQENFNKQLEILTYANVNSNTNIKENLTVLEKTSQKPSSNIDDLLETVKNVDIKLKRLEDDNKSINVSMNELNTQASSVRTFTNDALTSIQDLSKRVESTNEHFNEMSNKMNQLEISINVMSSEYKDQFEKICRNSKDKDATNIDYLLETVKNVNIKLNRLEAENMSVNVSIMELNKQISSVTNFSNDVIMSIQDLSKRAENTNQHYNEMSNKMDQLEISINLMSSQYTEQLENMSSRKNEKVDNLQLSKPRLNLEMLKEPLHKKEIFSKGHVLKQVEHFDKELAEISGKVTQIERKINHPTIGFFASKTLDASHICKYIDTFESVSANYGSHFNQSSGEFTAPLNGFYLIILNKHGGKETIGLHKISCIQKMKNPLSVIGDSRQLCSASNNGSVSRLVNLSSGDILVLHAFTQRQNGYGLSKISFSCCLIN
ncbi:unnamed protein product [Lymnaea stagnalis]|uniref:C1q domain-containing protein n=1 Tax=Lymnaea stagnalis TaxID=6523 RepID=A0AAV2IFE1_LYMST